VNDHEQPWGAVIFKASTRTMQNELSVCELYELHALRYCAATMTIPTALDAHPKLAKYFSFAFL